MAANRGGKLHDLARERRRVTDRDLRIAGWIGRQRFATASQIARRFDMDRSRTYRRLRAMAAGGLVDHHRVFQGPGVYLATDRGLAAAEVDLPPARVDIRTYVHDLALAGLCADYELAGLRTVTEREIRAADALAGDPRFAVVLGDRRLHYPDLIVHEPHGPVAVELERTPKRPARLDRIVGAYLRARHLAGVRYHAASPAVARVLVRAVARAHADEFIHIQGPRYEGPQIAPPQAAAREATR